MEAARGRQRAGPAVVPFLMAHGALFLAVQPYPIAAYNALLGGAGGARNLMIVGWGEGLEQVTDFLNAQEGAERSVVATNYNHIVRPQFRGRTYSLTRLPSRVTPSVDYVVLYVNTAQRMHLSSLTRQAISAGQPVFTARVNGLDYAWVFRVPKGGNVPLPPDTPEDENLDDLYEED